MNIEEEIQVTKRKGYLDFLKFIATVIIIFHHYQQSTGAYFSGWINFYNGKFYWGYMVELFFIISGFCIYRYEEYIAEGNVTLKDFYLKRLLRLLPMLFLGAVLYELASIAYARVYGRDWLGVKPSIWGTITDIFAVQEGWVFRNAFVNNPTWYCSVLMLCYFMFFFVITLSQKLEFNVSYAYIFMILLGCGIVKYEISLPFFNGATARGYYAFFVGIMMAKLLEKYQVSGKLYVLCIVSLAVFIYSFVKHTDWIGDDMPYLLTFVVYPAIMILLSCNAFDKLFSMKIWGFLGKISFVAFIFHGPFIPMLYVVNGKFGFDCNYNNISTMIAFCAIVFLGAVIGYYFYERPINSWIQKKGK